MKDLGLGNAWLVVAIALASWPAAAAPEAGTVELAWTAPADCPTASDVDAAIRTLLGRAPRFSDGRRLDVRARAEQKHDHTWIVTIETRLGTATGNRTFAAESCRAAADATALIVALMIDPQAVALHSAPRPAQSAVAVATSAPAPTTVALTSGAPPAAARPSLVTGFSVGPTVVVDDGTLPGLTYGAGARVGLRSGSSVIELGVLASAEARGTIPATVPPVGGNFRFRSASLSVCPAARWRRWDLGACAAAELTQVTGAGFGVSSSFENDARWLAVGGGALARLRLGARFAIPLRLDLMAPLARPTFVLHDVPEAHGEVYRPSRVVMRGSLALDVEF